MTQKSINGYDESTTVSKVEISPTPRFILGLPDNTEVVVIWRDGTIDGYDVDEPFKEHMRSSLGPGEEDRPSQGVVAIIYVTPDKMHPSIAAALQRKCEA